MATLAELDVIIKGDISQLTTALNDAKTSLLDFAGASDRALSQLGGTTRYIAPQIQQIDQSFQQLGNSSRALTPTITANNAGFSGFNMILRETHTLGYSLTRGITSLTYGFSTLGKEINEAKQSGQGWGSILSTIGTQFLTVDTAVILAGSAIALFAHHMLTGKQDVDEFKKAVEDSGKALNDAAGKAAEEGAKLQILGDIAANTALPFDQRVASVQKLQDMYPNYFGNLDKEAILTGNIKNELKELNKELLNKALAEAEGSNLTKFASQLAQVNDQLKDAKDNLEKIKTESAGKTTFTEDGVSMEAGMGEYMLAQQKVTELTQKQTEVTAEYNKHLDAMRGYAKDAGMSFEGMGDSAKNTGAILGELNRKMNDLDAMARATGTSEAKEKISALKSAITELIQSGVQPGNFEIQALIKQVKDLGGSFEDAARHAKSSTDQIAKILSDLRIARDELKNNPMVFSLDEPMKEIELIENAIKRLKESGASSDIIIRLRAEVDGLALSAVGGQLEKKFGDLKDFKLPEISAPLKIGISSVDVTTTLKEIQEQVTKSKEIEDLKKSGIDVFTNQHIKTSVDLLNDDEISKNFQNLTADTKRQLGEIAKMGQGIYQVFDSIFSELLTKGTISFKEIENALGKLIAKLIATVAEAAILSAVLQATGLGGSIGGGSGFGNILSKLLGFGGIKPHAEGGIFTKPTQIGNDLFGEAGPEALIPLKKLPDMMKSILGQSGTEDNANLKNILKSLLSFGNSETKVISKPNAEGKPEITDLNSEKLSGLMNDFSKANTTQQDTSFAGMIKKLFNQPNVVVDVKTNGSTNSNSLINNSALSNAINNSSVNNPSNLSNSSISNSSSENSSTTNSNLSPASLINPTDISSRISESISEMAKTVMNEEKSSDISRSKSVESNISSENIKSISSEVEGLKNIQNEIRSAVSNSQVQNSSLINSNISDRTSDVNSSSSNLSSLNSTERNSLNSNSVNNSISDSLRTIESSISNEVSNNRNVISQSSIEGLRNVQSEIANEIVKSIVSDSASSNNSSNTSNNISNSDISNESIRSQSNAITEGVKNIQSDIANEIVKNLVSDSSSVSNSSDSNTQSSSEDAKTISSAILSKVTESNNELLSNIKSSENSSNSDLSSLSKTSETNSNSSDLNSIKQNLSEQSKSIGSEILSSIKSNNVSNSSSSNISNSNLSDINQVRSSISDQIKQSELIKSIGKDFLSSKTISENNKSLFDTSEFRKVTTDNVRSLVKDNLSEKNLAASYFNPTDKNELIPLNKLSMLGTSQNGVDITLSGEFKQRGRDMVLALNQENIAQKRNYGKFA